MCPKVSNVPKITIVVVPLKVNLRFQFYFLPLPQKVTKRSSPHNAKPYGHRKICTSGSFFAHLRGRAQSAKTPFRLIFPFAPVRTLVAEFLTFCKVLWFYFQNRVILTRRIKTQY
jgi:hypothetical protein